MFLTRKSTIAKSDIRASYVALPVPVRLFMLCMRFLPVHWLIYHKCTIKLYTYLLWKLFSCTFLFVMRIPHFPLPHSGKVVFPPPCLPEEGCEKMYCKIIIKMNSYDIKINIIVVYMDELKKSYIRCGANHWLLK